MTAGRATPAIAALLLVACTAAPRGSSGAAAQPRQPPQGKALPALVEGTSLVVIRPDGRRVEGGALVGAVVVGGDPERGGGRAAFRIDGLRPDPDDPRITLHDLSVRDPASGGWRPYCAPDARGIAGALFLVGSWDLSGAHLRDDRFSVSCTSGAIGKCVRAGYRPWETMADGRSGWDYHQACVRLVRADYCGDGASHTRDGVTVEIIDRLGEDEEPGTDLAFEASWTPEGASCVARARLGGAPGLVAARCPARLGGRLGADCTLAGELTRPEVLLVNKSPPAVTP